MILGIMSRASSGPPEYGRLPLARISHTVTPAAKMSDLNVNVFVRRASGDIHAHGRRSPGRPLYSPAGALTASPKSAMRTSQFCVTRRFLQAMSLWIILLRWRCVRPRNIPPAIRQNRFSSVRSNFWCRSSRLPRSQYSVRKHWTPAFVIIIPTNSRMFRCPAILMSPIISCLYCSAETSFFGILSATRFRRRDPPAAVLSSASYVSAKLPLPTFRSIFTSSSAKMNLRDSFRSGSVKS
mmetsp:Transcript_31249/g.76241  ORF Transcript_31249/g.76241 Transcript_31249/m.76241 type:complete len:239 (-) Transcript_31249:150-866(-)